MAVKKAEKAPTIIHNDINKHINALNDVVRTTSKLIKEKSEELQSAKAQLAEWNALLNIVANRRNTRATGVGMVIGDDE